MFFEARTHFMTQIMNKLLIICFLIIKVQSSSATRLSRMQFLFADTIFSYNLADVITENDSLDQSSDQFTYVSANMLPGSFVCYILVKNKESYIQLNGPGSGKFQLKLENFGSTSLLTKESRHRKILFKLYSLKLSEKLLSDFEYELVLKLSDRQGHVIDVSKLTVHVNSTGDE